MDTAAMDVTTIILDSILFRMPKRAAPRDVGGCVVSLVNILAGEPLSLYAAMCQKQMFLIRCSNAELQNISCDRLHRYNSERTKWSRSNVGRKQNILHRGSCIRDMGQQSS